MYASFWPVKHASWWTPSSGNSFLWYKLVHIRKHWFRWKNQLVVKKLSIQLILNSYWIRLWPNQKYKNRNTVTQKCSIQKLRSSCVFSTRSVSKIRSYWLIYISEVYDWIYFDWLALSGWLRPLSGQNQFEIQPYR